jgi:hypothetical protein
MPKYKFKTEQMIEAIETAEGNLTQAARLLNCSRSTVHSYINKFVTVKKAYEDVNEQTIDFVENQLMVQVKRGNITAIIFYLKTKAKHRGYVERQEFQHGGKVTIVNWDDANGNSKD